MERVLEVRTAEAIAVRYDLAGIGSRFLALAIDVTIQFTGALLAVVAIALLAAPLSHVFTFMAKPVDVVAIALISLVTFAVFFGYFIVFELVWNGQTPGKRLLGIRVVRDAGFPVDAGASILRNVVRVVELAVGMYVISAIVMLVSNENKRAGDYAAGTIVVRDLATAAPALETLAYDDGDGDDGLDGSDRALIDAFLARRDALEPGAALELASRLAARIRPKLRASFHYLDDGALLEHLGRSRS